MCVCLGGKFSVGHNFSALKIFPFCRLATAPKATFNPLSPNGRRVPSFLFHIYREKVQNSRSAFTGWENSICSSRVAWLPPLWVPPVSQAQILCGNLCTSTEPVGPSCVHTNFPPILQRLAVGHSWPLRSLRLIKSFVVAPSGASPLWATTNQAETLQLLLPKSPVLSSPLLQG